MNQNDDGILIVSWFRTPEIRHKESHECAALEMHSDKPSASETGHHSSGSLVCSRITLC